MLRPIWLFALVIASVYFAAAANAADYRGMAPGWPTYANGYTPASYPANYYVASNGAGPAYYVARPLAPAYYSARPAAAAYVPVTAAYANPAYFAAYGKTTAAYRPVSAGYYPNSAGAAYAAAPAAAYYAPVTTNYAPANSYAVTPSGLGSAGSEAATYYGQPTVVNYVPPRYAYRTTYAAVPVYMYRPVTAYDPITAQPVTCLQPATTTQCQPQRCRSSLSWLNPFNWFRSSCGSSCGTPPAATTAYCTSGCAPAGQPYYPVAPPAIIQSTPAPFTTAPPPGYIPPATPRVPAFPTRPPAETRPSLGPTGVTVPGTGGPIQPFTPPGGVTVPGNPGFQQGPTSPFPGNPNPGGAVPGGPGTGTVVPGARDFPSGSNYPPSSDPYNNSTGSPSGSTASPSTNVFGSGYRNPPRIRPESGAVHSGNDNVIRAPDLAPPLAPSVETVPDLDGQRAPQPVNRAPQLLDPRDKTAASGDSRFAVVPAVWPVKAPAQQQQLSQRPVVATKATDRSPLQPPRNTAAYDDGGWTSAPGL